MGIIQIYTEIEREEKREGDPNTIIELNLLLRTMH